MFCSVVYEFLLMTQSKTCIFLIGQYNNLKMKSKNEFPKWTYQCFGVGSSTNRVVLFSSIVEERPEKITLSLFFQNVTFQHILSVYFISSLEMEIKYIYSLNNTQHYRLINRFYLHALKIHAENFFHQWGFLKNCSIGIYLKPILTYFCYVIKSYYF